MTTPPDQPAEDDTLAIEGQRLFVSQCSFCHEVNGLDPNSSEPYTYSELPNPDYGASVDITMASGNAPNLTNLMMRQHFVGGLLPLYEGEQTAEAVPSEGARREQHQALVAESGRGQADGPEQQPGHAQLQPVRGTDRPADRLPAHPQVSRATERGTTDLMAIIEERPPLELTTGEEPRQPHVDPMGVFARPTGDDRLEVVDQHRRSQEDRHHVRRRVALLLPRGGVEALLIRLQLAVPGNQLLSADLYNQVFTMHGVTMVFLVIMPLAAAFANYLLPLQIGARDVAFPRLNALSLWLWLTGAIFFNTSWFLGGGANGGWFDYAPNSGVVFSPGHGIDFYAVGLLIMGIGSTVSAVNLTVTVLNMRAPGMTLMKMPVFTWMAFIIQVLLVFALPVITVALLLLTFDRLFDANFFNVAAGGDPFLWQHLFWIFGHPEVYIMILPAFGIVSEVIPVFSRKPIFGYPFMVGSGIAIGFMGFGVWAHHMFASGMGPMSVLAFSLATMFIAVPTGVKILNWMATMYGGTTAVHTAMLFSVGLVAMFTIGGLSGVTHAVAPPTPSRPIPTTSSPTSTTCSSVVPCWFSTTGMYFWWPKVFGHFARQVLAGRGPKRPVRRRASSCRRSWRPAR